MTQLTEHAKTILRAVTDDKKIQISSMDCEPCDISMENALKLIANGYGAQLLIAPETRRINGAVFAAPIPITESGADIWIAGKKFVFSTIADANDARDAIIDALEGRTK